MEAVYFLWDDGVVVLKNEPLNVMGPQTLLFYRLGLEQQALVIRKLSLKKIHQIHTCIQNRDILQWKSLALKCLRKNVLSAQKTNLKKTSIKFLYFLQWSK